MRNLVFAASCGLAMIAAVGIAGSNVHGQASAPPPPPTPQASNGPPDTFMETARRAQECGAASLQAAGRAQNLTGLRSVIAATLKTRPWTVKIAGATPEELARQDVEAVAQFLATAGYGPNDVNPGAAGSAELIASAGRVVLGGAQFEDEVRVAPVVVLAELTGVTPDASADDGYHSTASLRVIKVVKGDVTAGGNISVRQRSGPTRNGDLVQAFGEFRPKESGGQHLLFLSPAAYEVRSGRKNASAAQYAQILATYRVTGDQLVPVGDIDHGPVPLSRINS